MARTGTRSNGQRVREEEAAAKQAEARRRSLIHSSVVGAVVVAAIAALVLLDPPLPGQEFPDLGNFHLASLEEPHANYNSAPPSSGPHTGGLAAWGESGDPVPPEVFVHNLEDRGIVLAYDCDCPDLVAALRSVLADKEGDRLLLTPYPGIVDSSGTPRRAAAVAWGRVLHFDDFEVAAGDVDDFIDLFEGIDHHVGGGTGGIHN